MGKTDTIQVPIFTADSPEYEADFHAWLVEQAGRLRLLRVPGIDSENLAEEIESLGRNDKREILRRSEVLLMHLLKWRYQSDLQGRIWRSTIDEQRHAIELVLDDSPSLRPVMPAILAKAYPVARRKAAMETGLALPIFPEACAWTSEEVLAEGFLPET